jgi:LPXTG-motif cell wall-anchored protein
MAMVLVVLAALCLVYSFLMATGDGTGNAGTVGIVGIILFMFGALLHMRKRRNEQLEAMRGRNDNTSAKNG